MGGKLSTLYSENLERIRARLRVKDSFDLIEKHLKIGKRDCSFFYIDGFVKDGEMLKIMQHLLSSGEVGTASDTLLGLPYVEVELCADEDKLVTAVLSGQTAIIAESFGGEAILADVRTYPARQTQEPESDKVMQGARDGFVETLVVNTALIRRRIRDERLTMEHINMGGMSKTDVVICYMKGD